MASFGNSVGQALSPALSPASHFSYGTHRNSTTGVDSPDIIGSRPKGALDYVLDRIVLGPGGRSVAD
jgi:hypothetical protein